MKISYLQNYGIQMLPEFQVLQGFFAKKYFTHFYTQPEFRESEYLRMQHQLTVILIFIPFI